MSIKSKSNDYVWINMMKIGAKTGCHQRADRSFFVRNRQFPICARCTGVVLGYIIALVVFIFCMTPLWLCTLLCVIMFLDWLIQYLKIKESNNIRRLITGILGGYGLLSFEINLATLITCYIAVK